MIGKTLINTSYIMSISNIFQVNKIIINLLGIPCLIIINPNNSVYITNEGRGMIEKDGVNAFDKWLTAMSFKWSDYNKRYE